MHDHKNPEQMEQSEPIEQVLTGDENSFAAGQILGGKYKIIALLGAGGMGKVYWVTQVFLNTDFALKVLDIQRVFDDVQMRRFQFEAKAANSLSHPNLVKVHDFGLLDTNQPYLVMDKIEGTTLSEHLRQKRELTLQEAAPLFEQICNGLAYAHAKGIVHRDIKPSNIILVASATPGTEGSIKILDFGIAKLASEEGGEMQQLTRTGEVFGSPLYMSPEQCSGSPVDHRSDIYSLGCVLFEALTGTPPHMGANALRTMMLHQSEPAPLLKQASLGKTFPLALEEIVKKMLQKDPNARYQYMSQVADDLNAALTNKKLARPKATNSSVVKATKMVTISQEKLVLLLLATIMITACITLAVALPAYTNWNKMIGQISKSDALKLEDDPGKGREKENQGDIEFFQTAGPELHGRHPEVTKLLFDNCNAIKSEPAIKHGKRYRRFVFPERSIGTISCRTGVSPVKPDEEWEARGIVLVPDGVPLMLHISGKRCPEIFQLTNIIAKIDAGEFSELGISSNIMEDRAVQAKGLQNILTIVNRWNKLHSLSLIGLPISPGSVAAIGKLKGVTKITIESPDVDYKLLGAQPFWERMTTVALNKTQSDEILSKLSHSSNLTNLYLSEIKLSPSSIKSLRNCKNLSYLMLDQHAVSTELLNAISQLKALEVVYLRKGVLQPDQVEELSRRMPWLKQMVLSPFTFKTLQATGISDKRIKRGDDESSI